MGVDTPVRRRVIIEPLHNRLRQPYQLDISRDFDSLISFTDELPVSQDLYIYRIFHQTLALSKSLHVKVRMRAQLGQPAQFVHPHKVPNVCIVQIGARHCIRLFFPALMQAAEARADLTDDQLSAIYDFGLYPVICHIAPELATNWSPTYAAAKLDTAHLLGYTIKHFLQDALPWAYGCMWMVQIQGVKEVHTHTPNEFMDSYDSFQALLDGLMQELIFEGQSWVDVGLQISEDNHVLQWRTDAHPLLVNEFSHLSENAVTVLCRSPSRSYQRDYVVGLTDLSGFRVTLNPPDPDPDSAYIQAYTMDKSLITHLEVGRHGLFMRGSDALHWDDDDRIPGYCKRMMSIYKAGTRHTTAARVEARVPVRTAVRAMLDFPEGLLERTLCRYSAVDWWQWRQIRMICIAETLALQNRVHPSLQYKKEALNLTAALVWLANGLNSRPDDDQYGRDVMMTSCITAGNHDNGAIFLCHILFPPISGVPRFSYGKELNNATWIHFFRKTPDELHLNALPPPYIPQQRLLEAGHVPTQKSMSRPHWAQIDAPLPELANLLFPLPPVPQDLAEDLPYNEQVEYLGDTAEKLPLLMTLLWQQFLSDVLQKCGNLHGAGADASHCRLSSRERQNIKQEAITNINLAVIFRRVQY
ncbi:hypothetical protein JVU11DRAFT_1096 [Chiua virens]|nr:hypothetical protein JVU11DRAFT_1096 [Chiua virens]